MVLVAGSAKGEAALRSELEGLWDDHAPSARRVLAAFGLRGERLDDALQETFVRAAAALRRGTETRSSRGFLLGIARHVAVDLTARARSTEGLGAEPLDRGRGPAARVERAELAALVRAASDELDPALRAALHLRHVGGVTMEELAQALACSVPTARARLSEAAARLAAGLRRRGVVPREGEERA